MTERGTKWLTGCAVGCGALLLIVVVVGIVLYSAVRRTVGDFKETTEAVTRVDKQFGSVESFLPEQNGRISPDRVESFLTVRAATESVRKDLQERVSTLEGLGKGSAKEHENFWDVIRAVRTGVGAIPQIARFHQARAEALMENRMGRGEYVYIYTLAYYSLLRKDPGDGPRHVEMNANNKVQWEGRADPEEAKESRARVTSRRANRLMTSILENSLRHEKGAQGAELSPWGAALQKEIQALKDDRYRIPWQDGLPKEIQECLEPFRVKLETTYDPVTNPMEFMDLERQ